MVLAVVLAGCQRGCLSTAREGPDPHGLSTLGGTDCSDGLARCTDGRIEVSRVAHLPYPCGKPGEPSRACECPWSVVDRCRNGCSLEGVTVLEGHDAGVVMAQLCKPDEVVARPLNATDPPVTGVCSDEGIACRDGLIRSCAGPGMPITPIAICIHGCEAAVGLPEGEVPSVLEGKTVDGAASILCRRVHAEHR